MTGRLSHRVDLVRPSPTLAMNKRAAQLRKDGRDIISLSLGEPDFHTPETVKAAGIAAIDRNFTKYTAPDGFTELKVAITEKMRRENRLDFGVNQVVVGSGAKIVILAILFSILDSGDEVIIPAPYWVSYPDLVTLAGGLPRYASATEAAGFKVTAEGLKSVLNKTTRALILNSPNNPTGAVYTREEMRSLGDVLKNWPDVWIVTDELYEHLVYGDSKAISFAHAVPDLADRTVTVNGFSKGYVMTGWRLGFAAGPKDILATIGDFLSQMHGSPSSIAQAAAIAALNGDQSFLARNLAILQERRDVVVQRAREIPRLSMVCPDATFYAFPSCAGMINRKSPSGRLLVTDNDVVEALLEEAEVAALPGSVFGASPYLRISYAIEISLLLEAMRRIALFADALE
jgi:aspartate aminotransferase